MSDKVVLLHFWASPFSHRTRIALSEKGIEYESLEENVVENLPDKKSELLLKLNPVHQKIPVLIHKGKPICESLIQIEYIDEVWKGNGSSILPSDPYQRAQARFWADFVEKKAFQGVRSIWATTGEAQADAVKDFIESLKVLEGELGDKPFFGGDNLGFVDIALVPIFAWYYALEKCANFCLEKECPKFIAWGKRCLERDSVAKTLPDKERVYEVVLQLKKIYGVE